MSSQDRFEVGDICNWSKESEALHELLRHKEEFGVGPFTVAKVMEFPLNKCRCGKELQGGVCEYAEVDLDNHQPWEGGQWIWIGLDNDKQFDSAWFEKV